MKATKLDNLSTSCLANESAKLLTDLPTCWNFTWIENAKTLILLRQNWNIQGMTVKEDTYEITLRESLSTSNLELNEEEAKFEQLLG